MNKSALTKEDFLRKGNYVPDEEIITLVNLSMMLEKPLLLEGPPGTGKTALAKSLSSILNAPLFRIQCYEGITSEQVIGEFNYTKQLLALEANKLSNKGLEDLYSPDFFIERPLLQALSADVQTVLLIDEIDRADEEFEAFLLESLGEKQVTIPEIGTIESKVFPVVILTSNATRVLSPALRRRSLFLSLAYPSMSREKEIIKLHFPEISETLTDQVLNIVRTLREYERITNPPSVAEALEFSQALLLLGEDLIEDPEPLLGILVKNKSDIIEAKKVI